MHTETIIAIATVGLFIVTTALALYTARLWRATGELVKDAKDTAERQLRAYVCVEKSSGAEAREDPGWPSFKLVIKNCGNTPAYDVVGHIGVGLQEYPPTTPLAVPPESVEGSLRSSMLLGPDCTTTFMGVFRQRPDPAQVRAINEGRAAMYVIGRFTYRDAFGKERRTSACLVWRGPNTGLQQFSIGNDAT